MSKERQLSDRVRSWLREDEHEDADRVLYAVLDQLDATPQRHAGWLARRFLIMDTRTFRIGIAAAAVLLLAIVGWRYLTDSPAGVSPSTSEAPTASEIPSDGPSLQGQQSLPAGTYWGSAPGEPTIGFTIAVPDGWAAVGNYGIESVDSAPPDLVHGLVFWDVANLYADPLDPSGGLLDPPLGPSVDDLVNALLAHDGWATSQPQEIMVGGHSGRLLELTVPSDADFAGCDASGSSTRPFAIWDARGGWRCMQGPGQTDYVYVLGVRGHRVVITLIGYPDWSGAYLGELQAMVASLDFEGD